MDNLLPRDGEALYFPDFFAKVEADALFGALLEGIAWRHEAIVMFGRQVMQPRLTAWYGDPGAHYTYSGITLTPLPWTAELETIRARLEPAAETTFNSVLLNRYRDQSDGMGWHSDDEPELGRDPVIASLSFGAPRDFQLRHRKDKSLKVSLKLAHGSLLLMRGETQHHWAHALPKRTAPLGPRINLTFRAIARSRFAR
jgi:alkylated DNA repair dioxygenase AlkB